MVHFVIFVIPGIFLYLNQVSHARVKYIAHGKQTSKQCTNVEGGEKCYISLKTAQQARSNHRTTSALLIQYMT